MTTSAARRAGRSSVAPYIEFDRAGDVSYYRQIFLGYRAAILEGRLRPGQRLPSTRALASELGISRLPVLNAFEQLLHEGYVEGRAGSGTYVATSLLDQSGAAGGSNRRRAINKALVPQPAEQSASVRREPGPFWISMPALDQFPHKTWSRLVARHARNTSIGAMVYGEPAGYLPLRIAIAEYLRTARAVSCEANQVQIVSGSQMALNLCALALLKPGQEVCVEDPGYPGARTALGMTGATVRPIPVDHEGLQVQTLAAGKRVARIVHVTPSHQYPLGVSMTAARRLELLEWARRNHAWIVEDDYDSEYRYASRPLGSLHGMDSNARVIYMGTFSKAVFPALRIGYIVAPPELAKTFASHREALDLFSPNLYQAVLADFLSQGHFGRHVRRMRAIYAKRRDALVAGINRRLGDALTIVNADAGLHLTALLAPGLDDRDVMRRAAERGISVMPLSAYYVGRASRSGLVLGFGGSDEAQLDRSLETLAQVIHSSPRSQPR
ncbi:MAG: PLP-dependent aminotransferase family protein [Steroidobacteraceae bacterium]